MKKFKNKTLATLAVLVMSAAGLAGCCDKAEEDKPKTAIENAAYYIDQIYQNENGKIKSSDFDRISKYTDDDNNVFTITWTVTIVTEGAPEGSVKVVAGKDKNGKDNENMSMIDIDEESDLDVDFKLSGVISKGDEKLDLSTLDLKMPKLHIATWDEYAAACKVSGSKAGDPKNTVMSVEGIVTTIIGAANGNSSNCLYVQDASGKGSYYVYNLADDPSTLVQKGQKVRVAGETNLYSGSYELVAPKITKVYTDAAAMPAPVDYTEKFAAATNLTDESITAAQGLYVEIKDVEISDEDIANGYFNFKKGNLKSYVRISSSVCPISKDAQTKMKADHAAKLGWIADVKGIINLFNGGFYLTPIDAEPFNFKSLPQLDDAGAVAFEKNSLTTKTEITKSGEVALPTAGGAYTDVAIAWASDNAELAKVEGGKVTYKLPTADATVKLTATLSRGTATDTKEFEVKLIGEIPWKTAAEVKVLEKDIANKTDSTEKYFVYGQIIDDPTADYCNFTIQSGDDTLLVYGCYANETERYGTKRQIAEIPFKKGDEILIKASLQHYVNVEKGEEKYEAMNALLISYKTPAAPFEVVHAGTEADPYTVEEALFVAKDYSKSVYDNDNKYNKYGDMKEVVVKGVISRAGTYDEAGTAQKNFQIVDAGSNKSLTVYICKFANGTDRVYLNDEVTVKGNLMNYSGTIEISNVDTYKDEGGKKVVESTAYPTFLNITAGKNEVTLGAHEGATVTGMPTEAQTNGSTVGNIVVTADEGRVIKNVKVNGAAIEAVEGKYSFVVTGPMTLTVTTEDANAQPVETYDVAMDFSGKTPAEATEFKADNNAAAFDYFKTALPAEQQSLLTGVTTSKIYARNATGGWKANEASNGYFKTGTGSAAGVLTLTFAETAKINKVVVSAHTWTASTTDTVSVNGSAPQVASTGDAVADLTFELDEATNVITINFANRCFVNKIVFSVVK